MLSHLFLGISLIGAEWVLYLLILLSVFSVTLMFERAGFYRKANRGLVDFRSQIRGAAAAGRYDEALQAARSRTSQIGRWARDLESEVALALLSSGQRRSPEVLNELAQDAIVRTRLDWERNLALLATIGNNAPFLGLFGTVLGIIKAFHDLSQANAGAQTVSAGISEALIATAVGILVAIPAVVAFNLFNRRVRSGLAQAEALKAFLVGNLASESGR
jgi:biopolymer transport protein ExbB